jgi:hypothetical protein
LPSKVQLLIRVYRNRKFLLLNICIGVVYYFLYQYLIFLSTQGILVQSVPAYLVYLLALSASVVITLSVYSVSQRLPRKKIVRGASSGVLGTASIVVAGITAGCACQAPILYNILYFVGLNTLEASSFVAMVNFYQIEIILALIAINVVLAYLTLSRIQSVMARQ